MTPVVAALKAEREGIEVPLAAVAADGTSRVAEAQQAAVTALQVVQRATEVALQQAGALAQAQAPAAPQATEQSLADYRRLTREAV